MELVFATKFARTQGNVETEKEQRKRSRKTQKNAAMQKKCEYRGREKE